MLVNRPEKPLGFHVLLLRTHLDLNQTQFGALLGINQPTVSFWESPQKKDEELQENLIGRFLELWDCFPTPPSGFDEVISILAEARQPRAQSEQQEMVPLLPARPIPGDLPPIYVGVRRPPSSSAGEDGSPAPKAPPASGVPPQPGLLPTLREAISWAGMFASILFVSCFVHADGPVPRDWESRPIPVSDQLYTDNAKVEPTPSGSIPMPSEPYPWQKLAPCDLKRGETEKIKACWIKTAAPPPCPSSAVEDEGQCFVPVTAPPRRPSTTTPKQQ